MNLNDVSAVFFDFGGTLVTLSTPRETLFIRAAESISLPLTVDAVQRAYQIVDFNNKFSSINVRDRSQFYRKYNELICEALGISSHFEELQPAIEAQFADHAGWVLMDDVNVVLSELQRRQLPLAIVANWDTNLENVSEGLGIKEFFSTIVASQAVGVEKPDPAIFRVAIEQLGLTDSQRRILHVGNEYKADVLGALAAGLTPVLIDRAGQYQHADCLRFRSLSDWLDWMRRGT